jgi:hypothetical protein
MEVTNASASCDSELMVRDIFTLTVFLKAVGPRLRTPCWIRKDAALGRHTPRDKSQ